MFCDFRMPTIGLLSSSLALGLLLINFSYLVLGVIILTFGSILVYDSFDTYLKMISIHFQCSYLFVLFGIVLILTFVLGVIGVCRANMCCLYAFVLILTLMLFLQIGFLMVGQEVRDTTDMTIIIDMNKTLSNYSFTDMFSKSNEFWDKMQHSFKCCGVMNASDYNTIFNHTVPESCCKKKINSCSNVVGNVYNNGCFDEIQKFLKVNVDGVAKIIIILAVMQILGLALTCFLIGSLRHGTRQDYENLE